MAQRRSDRQGILEPGGVEVDALRRAAHEAHVDVAEVVLGELSGQPLEAPHRPGRLRPHRCDEGVERALPALVPLEPSPPQDLQREHVGLRCQRVHHEGPEHLSLRRAPDAPPLRLAWLHADHRWLFLDTTYCPLRRPCKPGYLELRVAGSAQHLDLVPLHHVEHPPFPRLERWRALGAPVLLADGATRPDRPEFPEWMRPDFPELTQAPRAVAAEGRIEGPPYHCDVHA